MNKHSPSAPGGGELTKDTERSNGKGVQPQHHEHLAIHWRSVSSNGQWLRIRQRIIPRAERESIWPPGRFSKQKTPPPPALSAVRKHFEMSLFCQSSWWRNENAGVATAKNWSFYLLLLFHNFTSIAPVCARTKRTTAPPARSRCCCGNRTRKKCAGATTRRRCSAKTDRESCELCGGAPGAEGEADSGRPRFRPTRGRTGSSFATETTRQASWTRSGPRCPGRPRICRRGQWPKCPSGWSRWWACCCFCCWSWSRRIRRCHWPPSLGSQWECRKLAAVAAVSGDAVFLKEKITVSFLKNGKKLKRDCRHFYFTARYYFACDKNFFRDGFFSAIVASREPEPKRFGAEAGAWSFGSGSTALVCGASELYK